MILRQSLFLEFAYDIDPHRDNENLSEDEKDLYIIKRGDCCEIIEVYENKVLKKSGSPICLFIAPSGEKLTMTCNFFKNFPESLLSECGGDYFEIGSLPKFTGRSYQPSTAKFVHINEAGAVEGIADDHT